MKSENVQIKKQQQQKTPSAVTDSQILGTFTLVANALH